ncbi:phosphoribosylaminoimidazolesuccinocarboxamide synthase [Temperatibacter marinus]|uniref:Phosphoribosylaminoimidazole-succinocarboxamide synthase n=1 Tax=Temperatibacter marinus TaxID=1456591 RepID=A0AA52EHL4_9PROT|nr:phosphoribosylaminoimidazolesuccinocarboxamide synthase [Temperatibacter marinus]WND02216.1 phosphoribosylaminoimidazolesuccinocarboxamide synthase [Temperatibacter marinus]
MSRQNKIYEGKAKVLFKGPEDNTIVQYFKDDATAFNAEKRGTLSGKGVINNHISDHIFTSLERIGVPTHFIERLNPREQLIKACEIIPVEVIVRNTAAGSICKRLGLIEGEPLSETLVEFCYKSDEYGDPVISADHAVILGWATEEELEEMKYLTLRINDFLQGLFTANGINLIDFKLEFGRHFISEDEYEVILADEISPDGCRLWDAETNEKLDKDRFRRDLGGEMEAYLEVAKRLGVKFDVDPLTIPDDLER